MSRTGWELHQSVRMPADFYRKLAIIGNKLGHSEIMLSRKAIMVSHNASKVGFNEKKLAHATMNLSRSAIALQ